MRESGENAAMPMVATMMNAPLSVTDLFQRAEVCFAQQEVVSRRGGGHIERITYRDLGLRIRRLAAALKDLGIGKGDRVATLMWNHSVHLEAFYAVPAIGAVLHPLNPRLSADEVAWIVRDCGDRALLVDADLLPFWREVSTLAPLRLVFVNAPAEVSLTGDERDLATLYTGEPLAFWPITEDENTAIGICYTSGTTGRPKGVAFSHRSTVLHAMAASLPDALNLSVRDTIFPLTPMFHVNAWGAPFSAVLSGARLVLPGQRITPEETLDMIERERVTCALGVPTIWAGVLDALDSAPGRWTLRPGIRLEVGGAAAPPDMFRRFDAYGAALRTGWGMTECSSIATLNWLMPAHDMLDEDARLAKRCANGLPLPTVHMRIVREDGTEAPWDGEAIGELQVRGPWITARYLHDLHAATADGWLQTGDVATIGPDGYLKLIDRLKDLVKSGGEWISSIDMENALVAHPDVVEAAVIAVEDPRWSERPLAVLSLTSSAVLDPDGLRRHLAAHYPKWMLPDVFVTVDAMPKTSTGKIDKKALRTRFSAGPEGRR